MKASQVSCGKVGVIDNWMSGKREFEVTMCQRDLSVTNGFFESVKSYHCAHKSLENRFPLLLYHKFVHLSEFDLV
jgi:hypothetical protein